MNPQVAAIDAALDALRTGFASDGYEIVVDSIDGGSVNIRIVAGPDACAECLVPKDTMRAILGAALTAVPNITTIELSYPVELDHASA